MSALTTRDITLGEHTLHVHQAGDPSGPPVLWLHGSGPGVSALSNWERLITRLMPGFRNIAPDVLGFGESSHPQDPPRGLTAYTALRARTTLALLDELGLEKVHVVGNSMGGMIALRMMLDAPERLDRALLMGSGGAPGGPSPALTEMVLFYEDPTPAAMRKLLDSFIFDTSVFGDDLDAIAADRVAKAMRPQVRRSHLATFDPSAGPPLTYTPEQLATIPHEVLLMHGREDQVIPVERSHYLLTHLDNAQLHVLPHAGHWMQIEQPGRFAAQAEAFLLEKRPAQSGRHCS
jgi:2-hydroxymuconate-semialdehyde hydrolase